MFVLKSLKTRLLAMNLTSTGAALCVACVILGACDLHSYRNEMVARAQTFASVVAGNCTAALSFNDSNDATQTLSSLHFAQHILSACVYDRTGKRLASYARDSQVALPLAGDVPPGQFRFRPDALEVASRIDMNGQFLGVAVIRSDLAPLHARIRGYFIVFGLAAAGALAVALGLAGRLGRVVMGPIRHLSATATEVSANRNYSIRAEKTTQDELGAFVDCFNSMLDQIEDRDRLLTLHRNHLEELVEARTLELSLAKDKAEEASRAKSNFLANMSHEIRTPMTAVLGYADLMLSPMQTMSDRINCLQVVRRNARHLMDLINDILDLSKIEAEKMTVEKIPCDPARVAVEVVSMLRPRAIAKNLPLAVEFSGAIPVEIWTDPLRLRQVLMNVTGNAVKFTQKGGVRVKVSVDKSNGAARMRFDVIDTGIGMTGDQVLKLFKPFVQADESMTRKYGGTGLGLAISKRLAGLLGGELAVESEAGKGTAFSVWVETGPIDGVEMREGLTESMFGIGTPHLDAEPINLKGRILLVEDGIDNQHLLTTLLTAAGAEVTVAPNGKLGVDLLEQSSFDIVLMDMQMPVMDGYAAAAEARRLGHRLPIIALTAHAMSGDRAKCIEAGCTDYLTKPIDQDLLLRTVSGHMIVMPPEAGGAVPGEEAHGVGASAAAETQPTLARALPPSTSAAPAVPSSQPAPVAGGAATAKPQTPAEVRAEAMQKAVIGFVSRLPAKVDALLSIRAEENFDELRRLVHQLKGAGAGYGFPELTEAASHAEVCIKEHSSIESIHETVDQLIELIRNTAGYNHADEGSIKQGARDNA